MKINELTIKELHDYYELGHSVVLECYKTKDINPEAKKRYPEITNIMRKISEEIYKRLKELE